jgi:hypothetical protein
MFNSSPGHLLKPLLVRYYILLKGCRGDRHCSVCGGAVANTLSTSRTSHPVTPCRRHAHILCGALLSPSLPPSLSLPLSPSLSLPPLCLTVSLSLSLSVTLSPPLSLSIFALCVLRCNFPQSLFHPPPVCLSLCSCFVYHAFTETR